MKIKVHCKSPQTLLLYRLNYDWSFLKLGTMYSILIISVITDVLSKIENGVIVTANKY